MKQNGRLVQYDRKVSEELTITRYNQGNQNKIFESTEKLEADGLLQQERTTLGAAPFSQKQEMDASILTKSNKTQQ